MIVAAKRSTIHVTKKPTDLSHPSYLLAMSGGRDRTRTGDLLRVKNHTASGRRFIERY